MLYYAQFNETNILRIIRSIFNRTIRSKISLNSVSTVNNFIFNA